MPLVQFEFARYKSLSWLGSVPPTDRPKIVRGYALSFPLDWEAQLADGPLPVVVVFHGGGDLPVDFLTNRLKVQDWWTGKWEQSVASDGVRIKAIVIAPMGVSMNDDLGGDWNAGNMGQLNRDALIDDEEFVFHVLEQAEAWFQEAMHSRAWQMYAKNWEGDQFFYFQPIPIFDRERISFVGFSQGGQMAYRMANRVRDLDWSVKGLVVFSSSIGGWFSETEHLNNPSSPDVDWSPVVGAGPAFATVKVASLFHIHGDADTRAPAIVNGPSQEVRDQAELQVPPSVGNAEDFMRADISGVQSAQAYADALTVAYGMPSGAGPPFPAPAAAANLFFGVPAPSFSAEWTVVGGHRRVFFARVGGMTHMVPEWGPEACVNFLLQEGGL